MQTVKCFPKLETFLTGTLETNLTTFYVCYVARHVTEMFITFYWPQLNNSLSLSYSNSQILSILRKNVKIWNKKILKKQTFRSTPPPKLAWRKELARKFRAKVGFVLG